MVVIVFLYLTERASRLTRCVEILWSHGYSVLDARSNSPGSNPGAQGHNVARCGKTLNPLSVPLFMQVYK